MPDTIRISRIHVCWVTTFTYILRKQTFVLLNVVTMQCAMPMKHAIGQYGLTDETDL